MTTTVYPDTKLLINNQWVDAANKADRPVVNPATGETIGTVACAGQSDLDQALDAAQRGFETWRKMAAYDRSLIMRKAAGLVRERADDIARLMTMEQGKPLGEAKGEIIAGAAIIDWFADEGMRVYGRIVPSRNPASQQLVYKEPIGPVAAFTPWNFPINQVVRKLGGALAAGCSFLCKAAEETPASPAALFQAFIDAGIPEGVVGLVYGEPAEISSYLIPHPIIRKVTFTGSTVVGKQLAAMAGSHMKPVTMELGGHAPVIVAADADIDVAVKITSSAKFRNAGQVCISPTRFLVHESIADQFAEKFVARAQGVKLGDGLAQDTTMGPLANPRRIEAMERVMANALESGAEVLTGGERVGTAGNFFAPTVVRTESVTLDLFNSEPFGPVAGIKTFSALEEAIVEANRLPYGLAAYAFTQSYRNVQLLSHEVQAGMLWINQPSTPSAELPFGGIKDSGYGSEGGYEAVEAYLNTKSVAITGV